MKRIYLDHASTTPLNKTVKKEMDRYFDVDFGNAGAIHTEGVFAGRALREARSRIARVLSSKQNEVIFTGSGTEANNIAILGTVVSARKEGVAFNEMHIVTSVIEHSSVLQCFKALERQGVMVSYIPVSPDGIVNVKDISSVVRPNTVLVSIMYANNEIGTVQPIREIGKIIREHNLNNGNGKKFKTFFHSDASQAPLYLPLSVESLGVDLLTLDGHKIYGPKGVGMLYIRKGTSISPIASGGRQEFGFRPGTENIPSIVGLAKAIEIANDKRVSEAKRLQTLQHYAFSKILKTIPNVVVNGSRKYRLPNNVNISIPNIDSEFIVVALDQAGIACSTKSSCLPGEEFSYVIKALGEDILRAHSSLRFSFGRSTTKKDIDYLVKTLSKLVSK